MFSIVIANWNGSKLIDKCLTSLLKQSYNNFNVYIVDNGSTDNSVEVINGYTNNMNIDLIRLDKNEGFAKANNIGIERAMPDNNQFILTLNNDIELKEDCLEVLSSVVNKNNDYDIFQILMINYFDRDIIDTVGLDFDKNYIGFQLGYKDSIDNLNKYNTDISGACAGAALFSKKCLISVKDKNGDYFDSDFFAYFEDVDLAFRLKNIGFKAYFAKDAIVYHMHSATSNKNTSFKEYYISRNLLLYVYKNLDINVYKAKRIKYFKLFLFRNIKYLLSRDMKCLKASLKGIKDFNTMKYDIKKKNRS